MVHAVVSLWPRRGCLTFENQTESQARSIRGVTQQFQFNQDHIQSVTLRRFHRKILTFPSLILVALQQSILL